MTSAAALFSGLHKGGTGPASWQELLPQSITTAGSVGTVVGGSNNDAGRLAVLTDGSDATYIEVPDSGQVTIQLTTMSDLSGVAGRTVSSFIILVRLQRTDPANEVWLTSIPQGILPFPSSADHLPKAAPDQGVQPWVNLAAGPFSRAFGGTWTAADLNALWVRILKQDGAMRISRISVLVSFGE